ncbi:uncharacterized protein IWZ02DRAFT_18907 [Phyllosticta citriasiana]|uniref:Uncharacterized protein n=1 Tax=Phyllosticta citriasiana TaxID=595635 RepID=A0ABR1KEM9_9PEZI
MLPRLSLPKTAEKIGKTPIVRYQTLRLASSDTKSKPQESETAKSVKDEPQLKQNTGQTQTEKDEELKRKMAGIAGDGGEAGVEYEDGQPTAMKRSVRNNMFRYI